MPRVDIEDAIVAAAIEGEDDGSVKWGAVQRTGGMRLVVVYPPRSATAGFLEDHQMHIAWVIDGNASTTCEAVHGVRVRCVVTPNGVRWKRETANR